MERDIPDSGPAVDFFHLILLGVGVVLVTRHALIRGIELTADAWGWPRKVRGQILGYATSAPELVGTVGTAAKGLLGAGLWNVAASNIINLFLFIVASVTYGRTKVLVRRKYIDEFGFAVGAILLPLLLATRETWARSLWSGLFLFLFFIVYLVVDRLVNQEPEGKETSVAGPSRGPFGAMLVVLGLLGVIGLGHFLGITAARIVTQLEVPEAAVGWILGVITSLPELTSFFAVFAANRDQLDDSDCQQNLDNLAASNMSNIGLIYPLGILIYSMVVL